MVSLTYPRQTYISSYMAHKEAVEKQIRKIFPSRWTKENIKFFLGPLRYDIDVSSVNDNLNFPVRDFVLRGGKRIRPVLFLVALQAFG